MKPENDRKAGHGNWWLFGLFLLLAYIVAQSQFSTDPGKASVESLPVDGQTAVNDNPPIEIFSDSNLHYDFLTELRPQEFISPAGLRYTRGSEQGHRLDHLARHLHDQPDRPGRHGVFEADMRQVLFWLDQAYSKASSKAKGTSMRQEDRRTVIETTFEENLGYIGGREGRRINNPKTKRLRLVIDQDRVITAFPF